MVPRRLEGQLRRPGPHLLPERDPDQPGLGSELGSGIDLVLSRGDAKAISAHVVGATPFRAAPPLYASDHAGVVATLEFDD